jgi:hypothetical protein
MAAMNFTSKTDFSVVPVIDVARHFYGEENEERSTRNEKHFPDHAGLFVNIEKNLWCSHGHEEGGDAISLVEYQLGYLPAVCILASRKWLYPKTATNQPKVCLHVPLRQ